MAPSFRSHFIKGYGLPYPFFMARFYGRYPWLLLCACLLFSGGLASPVQGSFTSQGQASAQDMRPVIDGTFDVDLPAPLAVSKDYDPVGRPLAALTFVDAGAGESFPFIIDTAASHTVLYPNLVAALGMQADPLLSKRVMTATGTADMPVYSPGALKFAGFDFFVRETVAMPQGRRLYAYGLIGIDLLHGRVLHLPKGGAAMLLSDASKLPGEGWKSVQGRPVGYGSVAIDIQMDQETVPAIVDTGASVTVLNAQASLLFLQQTVQGQAGSAARLESSTGQMSGQRVFLKRVMVGDQKLQDKTVLAAPLPVFRTFGASTVPAAILGMDILGQMEVAIDFRNWQLWYRES